MAGYRDFQNYRHHNEEFTEDEDEDGVDETEFTEDDRTEDEDEGEDDEKDRTEDEEDCVPYQDRQPPYHYYYAPVSHNYYGPVSYHQHHHHHHLYHQDVTDDESDASVTEDSTSSETDDGYEDEVKESKGSRTQTNNVWRVINSGQEHKKKQKDRKEKADTKPSETKGKTRRTRRHVCQ